MKKALLSIIILISFNLNAQENQNSEIAKLASGKFSVYNTDAKKKISKSTKPWPVEFKKEGNTYTEVLIKRAGIIDEIYKVDLPGFPAYYKNSSIYSVSVIDKKIYYYSYSIKTGANIKYILTEKNVGNYDSEKAIIDNYRKTIKTLQSSARDTRIEEKEAVDAKLASENSLKGKSIKSIKLKLIDPPSEIGMLTIVKIGIEFELVDGTILKTKNLGGNTPYTDFESSVKGGAFEGGDFKVAGNASEIPNDKIEVTVWSKYDSKKIKGSISHPINYKSDIGYQFQGAWGKSGRGYTQGYTVNGTNGKDGKSVNITAELMTINNEKVNKITIKDAMTNKVLGICKLHIDYTIGIYAMGGNGGDGERGKLTSSGNGGDGGDGGNGGTVTLSGSGANLLKIKVDNKGGIGGKGGSAKETYNTNGSNGVTGNKGTFIK